MRNFYRELEKIKVWLEKSNWPVKITKEKVEGRTSYSLCIGNSHETHSFVMLSQIEERRLDKRDPEQRVIYDFTGYSDKGVVNAGRKQHTEDEIAEQIEMLVKIMDIDEKEIVNLVKDFRYKAENGIPYKVYPENKREWISPIPGVAFPRDNHS